MEECLTRIRRGECVHIREGAQKVIRSQHREGEGQERARESKKELERKRDRKRERRSERKRESEKGDRKRERERKRERKRERQEEILFEMFDLPKQESVARFRLCARNTVRKKKSLSLALKTISCVPPPGDRATRKRPVPVVFRCSWMFSDVFRVT